MKVVIIIGLICLVFGSIYTVINFICISQILKNNPENYEEKVFNNKLTHFAIGGLLLGVGLGVGLGWVFDMF